MTPASSPSARIPPTPREVDRDSRTAAAGTGLRRQPPFTRAEKVAEAQRLRAQGLKLREIGERLGVAVQTVSDYLNDPDLARLRARKESYRGVCVDCGAPTGGHNGRNAPERCARCQITALNALNIQRGRAHQALIERLWAEGKTCREIGRAMGWTCNPSPHLATLRTRGYDLPPRRTPEQIARITAASAGNLAKAREVVRRNREAA